MAERTYVLVCERCRAEVGAGVVAKGGGVLLALAMRRAQVEHAYASPACAKSGVKAVERAATAPPRR